MVPHTELEAWYAMRLPRRTRRQVRRTERWCARGCPPPRDWRRLSATSVALALTILFWTYGIRWLAAGFIALYDLIH